MEKIMEKFVNGFYGYKLKHMIGHREMYYGQF